MKKRELITSKEQLKDCCIKIGSNKQLSYLVQTKLRELGFTWISGSSEFKDFTEQTDGIRLIVNSLGCHIVNVFYNDHDQIKPSQLGIKKWMYKEKAAIKKMAKGLNLEPDEIKDFTFNKDRFVFEIEPITKIKSVVNSIKALRECNEPEKEEKQLPKTWYELGEISGYFIQVNSATKQYVSTTTEANKNIFQTEKQAKSSLAKAQLSQLMHVYNDGWVADWGDVNENKFAIARGFYGIKISCLVARYTFLSFKTAEIRNEFLKNFKDLIKEYFEL